MQLPCRHVPVIITHKSKENKTYPNNGCYGTAIRGWRANPVRGVRSMTQILPSQSKFGTVQKNVPCNFSEYFPFPCIFQHPVSGSGMGITFIIQVYKLRGTTGDSHPGVVVPGFRGSCRNWRALRRQDTTWLRSLSAPSPWICAQYLQICFQRCPDIPVTEGCSLLKVVFDSLLSFFRFQCGVGLSPGNPQNCLMHVDWPEIAGGLGGVGRELPSMALLIVAQLVDGSPQACTSHGCQIDELLHRLQVAHDGVSWMHPAWGCKERDGAWKQGLPQLPPSTVELFLHNPGCTQWFQISVLFGKQLAFL